MVESFWRLKLRTTSLRKLIANDDFVYLLGLFFKFCCIGLTNGWGICTRICKA